MRNLRDFNLKMNNKTHINKKLNEKNELTQKKKVSITTAQEL